MLDSAWVNVLIHACAYQIVKISELALDADLIFDELREADLDVKIHEMFRSVVMVGQY